jgi:hypothetical protein
MNKAHSLGSLLCPLNSTMCLQQPTRWENQKCCQKFFRFCFLKKKGRTLPYESFHLFLNTPFLVKLGSQPFCKFHKEKCMFPTYWMMPSMLRFLEWMTVVGGTQIRGNSRAGPYGHYFGSLCRDHWCIRNQYTSILISFNRYKLRLALCGIWIRVIHLGFER